MKVVVGLGNPGRQYEGTRHNVGFEVVEYLARSPQTGPFRSKFSARVADLGGEPEPVLLMAPETYMNLSGRAVRQVVDFYKLNPTDLLVITDDVNLPLGKLRVRAKGSHGGHNGLRSIQEMLGTPDYPRLRIGVGGTTADLADYVLSRFKPGERPTIDEAVSQAASAVLLWLRQGIEVCMNRVNGADPDKPPRPGRGGGRGGQPPADKPPPTAAGDQPTAAGDQPTRDS
jgi:PTH1 family peptidyl-tRNA hydrolase